MRQYQNYLRDNACCQTPLVMLDLCSGFGGASEAMRHRGWSTIRVDNEPQVKPDVVADVAALPFSPFHVDLLWASPTCTEYSIWDQRGLFPHPTVPDLTLWQTIERIIAEWKPRFWIIENVRGARYFHGKSAYHVGSRYLWTNLMLFPTHISVPFRPKKNLSSGKDPLRSAKRGRIPYEISLAVARLIEGLCTN